MRKIKPKTWNRLIAVGQKKGDWSSQITYMNGSWTWTMQSGLNIGERGRLGGGGQKRRKLGKL